MSSNADPEIAAITTVDEALKQLESSAKQRVLEYVAKKHGLAMFTSATDVRAAPASEFVTPVAGADYHPDSDTVSPIAQKWLRRNGIDASQLSKVFSIGGSDIDLIAKEVPGENKKERMHSVILLKGLASYLAFGLAKASDSEVREACLHYKALDNANYATHMRSFASEVSGTKEVGYTLNARGLAAATDLLKRMLE